jgi:hypothetical protein
LQESRLSHSTSDADSAGWIEADMVAWNKNLLLCGTLLRKRKAINRLINRGKQTGNRPAARGRDR